MAPVPILRIFDETRAREFYVGFLGFKIDWEHRFAPTAPLYMQVSREGCVLHLSEHHGDGCPGAALRVGVEGGVAAYQQALVAKQYKYYRPGLIETAWGTRECSVQDPFGNKLIFSEPLARESAG
ncbi:MAG: glyoxalase superfamily protein [Planctomycetota bacterium]